MTTANASSSLKKILKVADTINSSEMEVQDPIIKVRDLIHVYQGSTLGGSGTFSSGKTIALRGIDLDIRPQTMTAIVGESGSGKTTLLNIIGGLLRPTYGTVMVNGFQLEVMSSRDRHALRNHFFGFIQQFSHQNIFFDLTARQNLEIPLLLRDVTTKKIREHVEEFKEFVSFKNLLEQPAYTLSGGERQLISLMVAIAHDPLIILADEPTAEMDPSMAKVAMEIFKKLMQEHGKTIIITTHDPMVVKQCDHVIRLRKGVIEGVMDREGIQHKTPEEIHELMTSSFQYLSVDQFGRITFPRKLLDKLGIKDRVVAIVKGRKIIISADETLLKD